MQKLYRYSDYLGLDFFDNPTIPLSLPSTLNDPFESSLSEDLFKYISTHFKHDIDKAVENLKFTMSEYLNLIGVTSLSETNRNLLMWAHYANHHKGICLGISEDFLLHKSEMPFLYAENYYVRGLTKPQKINYDNKRFDTTEHEIIDYSRFKSGEFINDYIIKHLMVKGDEWICEKEHRTITPLGCFDEIKNIGLNSNPELLDLLQHSIRLNECHKTSKTEEKYAFKDQTHKNLFVNLACNKRFNYAKGLLFLVSLKPEHVISLHLGHRFSHEEEKNIINKVSDPKHKLNHIKIYKRHVNPERFELDAYQIYPMHSKKRV